MACFLSTLYEISRQQISSPVFMRTSGKNENSQLSRGNLENSCGKDSLWKRGGVLAAAIETPFTASVLPSVLNNIFLLFIDLSFLDLEMIFLPKSLR